MHINRNQEERHKCNQTRDIGPISRARIITVVRGAEDRESEGSRNQLLLRKRSDERARRRTAAPLHRTGRTACDIVHRGSR
ncbi:unnamed protein product [Colias eurytheme]|nr:unnamed protein product [Colias eurytheme]